MIIKLSDTTMALLRAAATMSFHQTATKVGDWWETPISEEILEQLREYALEGETPDETVLRLFSGKAQ